MNAAEGTMDHDQRAGLCQERAGFLFKHACDQLSMNQCAGCGKQICAGHTHESEQGGLCTSCARQEMKPEEAGRRARIGHDPFFYGYGLYHSYGSQRHDRADFTEADGRQLTGGGEAWEREMGES